MSADRPTIVGELSAAARDHGDQLAVIAGDHRMTYGELYQRAALLAGVLRSNGVRAGDRVCLLMADCREWVVAWYAIALAGGVVVPINTRYRDRELRYLVQELEPAAVITGGDAQLSYNAGLSSAAVGEQQPVGLDRLRAVWPSLACVITTEADPPPGFLAFPTSGHDAIAVAGAVVSTDADISRCGADVPDDIAVILYTSGTTGAPKGAMIREAPLLVNSRNIAVQMRMLPDDRFLLPVPLFSASGTGALVQSLVNRSTLVVSEGRFSAAGLVELIRRSAPTVMFAFDQVVNALREQFGDVPPDWFGVRTGNGAPMTRGNMVYLLETLGASEFVSVYGMSEASTAVAMSDTDDDLDVKVETSGRTLPDIEVEIRDAASGEPVAAGVEGEICVRGFTTTPGYFRRPAETAAAYWPHGWFRTGDLGLVRDDGRLVYRGRIKEVIKPNGFNVSTREIEAAVASVVEAREVAVVGVPHPELGEAPVVFVEFTGPAIMLTELRARLAGQIATYKIPVDLVSVTSWPRTPTGKVVKQDLRARYADVERRAHG